MAQYSGNITDRQKIVEAKHGHISLKNILKAINRKTNSLSLYLAHGNLDLLRLSKHTINRLIHYTLTLKDSRFKFNKKSLPRYFTHVFIFADYEIFKK